MTEEIWRRGLGERQIVRWGRSWTWKRPRKRPWPWGRGDTLGAAKRDKGHIQCFNCKNYGHYANRCPEKKKGEEAHHARAEKVELALLLAITEEPESFEHTLTDLNQRPGGQGTVILKEDRVILELHLTCGGVNTGNVWYLDNGASNHMAGDLGKFLELPRSPAM
jgi:hypothetical protein